MKTIIFITVAATLIGSAMNTSSVGGSLTALLIAVVAMWAVGLHEIWSKRLGWLGSIGSIVLSFIGGAAGLVIGSQIMETMLSLVHIEGSLAKSNHPLFYVVSVAMAILTVLGSWSAIQIIVLIKNRRYGVRDNA